MHQAVRTKKQKKKEIVAICNAHTEKKKKKGHAADYMFNMN